MAVTAIAIVIVVYCSGYIILFYFILGDILFYCNVYIILLY